MEEPRRPRRSGRQPRRSRDPVPAHFDPIWSDDYDDPDGSAGVREPRRPRPSGPLSGAGEPPEPTPFLVASLSS